MPSLTPPHRNMCVLLWDNFQFTHFTSRSSCCPLGSSWSWISQQQHNNFNNIKVLLFISWPINYSRIRYSKNTQFLERRGRQLNSPLAWLHWIVELKNLSDLHGIQMMIIHNTHDQGEARSTKDLLFLWTHCMLLHASWGVENLRQQLRSVFCELILIFFVAALDFFSLLYIFARDFTAHFSSRWNPQKFFFIIQSSMVRIFSFQP